MSGVTSIVGALDVHHQGIVTSAVVRNETEAASEARSYRRRPPAGRRCNGARHFYSAFRPKVSHGCIKAA
jgi:hypothetical protein